MSKKSFKGKKQLKLFKPNNTSNKVKFIIVYMIKKVSLSTLFSDDYHSTQHMFIFYDF